MNGTFNKKATGIGRFPPMSQSFAASAMGTGRLPLTNTLSLGR